MHDADYNVFIEIRVMLIQLCGHLEDVVCGVQTERCFYYTVQPIYIYIG